MKNNLSAIHPAVDDSRDSQGTAAVLTHEFRDTIRVHWRWVLAFGILAIVGGLIAILSPITGILAVEMAIGVMLLTGSIPFLGLTLRASDRGHRLAFGALWMMMMTLGWLLVADAPGAAKWTGFMLAVGLLVYGFLKMILAFRFRQFTDRTLWIAVGAINLVAGLVVLNLWGNISNWAAGAAAGLGFMIIGVTWLRVALRDRRRAIN